MIITNSNRVVSAKNVTENNGFTIAANSHAFRILSDGLYSDKIKAILRELSCNAIDATKAANSTKPFEIFLPNHITPLFKIRDYGVGLSHENVMHLFTTYFLSDKNGSNDSIGGFGLGSKSPFAYTDSFSVVSYYSGTKSTYTAYISDNDCPQIVLLSQEDTDEHNGLEISFPVKSEDMNTFKSKLQQVCLYFDIQPTVYNAVFEHKTQSYIMKNDKWGERTTDYNRCQIIMGGVAYPIKESIFDEEENDLYRYIVRYMRLDFFMDIGSISINPSREALNYKKQDLDSIKNFIDEVIKPSIKETISKQINSAKSVWDAYVQLDTLTRQSQLIKKLTTEKDLQLFYKDTPIDPSGEIKDQIVAPQTMVLWWCADNSWLKKKKMSVVGGKLQAISPSENVTIIFDDLKRGGKQRIDYFLKTNRSISCVVVDVLLTELPNYSKETIETMFFGASVRLASSLNERPKKAKTEQKYKYYVEKSSSGRYFLEDYYDTKTDFTSMLQKAKDTGVYVFCGTLHKDKPFTASDAQRVYDSLRKFSLINKIMFIYVPVGGHLFNITKGFDNVVYTSGGIIASMKTLFEQRISNNSRAMSIVDHIKMVGSGGVSNSWRGLLEAYQLNRSATNHNTTLDSLSINMVKTKNYINRLEKKVGSYNLSYLFKFLTDSDTVDQQDTLLAKKYPLVGIIIDRCTSWQIQEKIDHIVFYMNSVDEKSGE